MLLPEERVTSGANIHTFLHKVELQVSRQVTNLQELHSHLAWRYSVGCWLAILQADHGLSLLPLNTYLMILSTSQSALLSMKSSKISKRLLRKPTMLEAKAVIKVMTELKNDPDTFYFHNKVVL